MAVLCNEYGIHHEFSGPYTPQQNGVAECKNRTLIETVRMMLADSHLPVMFWNEAVHASCYTLNKVLTVNKFKTTSFKLLNNRKPNLEFLEPFRAHVRCLTHQTNLELKLKRDSSWDTICWINVCSTNARSMSKNGLMLMFNDIRKMLQATARLDVWLQKTLSIIQSRKIDWRYCCSNVLRVWKCGQFCIGPLDHRK